MLKIERAQQWLKSAAATTIVTLTGACAHTGDAVYGPANAPQQATGSTATYEAPASAAPAAAEPGAPAPSATPGASADSYGDTDPTALQDFHPALDAHGTWAEDPTYGTVWTPSVAETGPGFVPYVSGGRWVYGADYAWNSDYSWGWAPFHYGRWVHLEARGWAWIPGREYAPAWVEWRTGDAYVGWSPAPPLFVWRGGVAVTLGFAPPAPPFVFCGHADLFAPQPGRVVIMGPRALAIGRSTRLYGAPDAHGHFHPGPPLASLHIAPERVVRATGHERGLARAQAFSRPSSASHLGAHPPTIERGAGRDVSRSGPEPRQARSHVDERRPDRVRAEETRSQAQREGARTKGTRTEGSRLKVTRTEAPRPKLAHAASPRPKVTHAQSPRPEGRAERQAPEPHQAQRQGATRPAAARSEGARSEHVVRHEEPTRVETHAVSGGSERNASPPVTHKPASRSEGPTREPRK